MKTTIHLLCDAGGVRKMSKGVPSISRGQIAVRLHITVPDGVFKTFIPAAFIEVPESAVIMPTIEVVQPEPQVLDGEAARSADLSTDAAGTNNKGAAT